MCPVNLFSLLTGEDSGGTFTQIGGPSVVNISNPSSVDFTGVTVGTYSFRYTVGTGACSDSTLVTVNVVAGANAGFNSNVSMCTSDPTMAFLVPGGDTGGMFSGTVPSGVVVNYNPANPSFNVNPNGTYTGSFTLTYTVATPGSPAGCSNCTDTSTHTVTIVSAPNAGTGSSITVCS